MKLKHLTLINRLKISNIDDLKGRVQIVYNFVSAYNFIDVNLDFGIGKGI
jgi:hypothetical protein